MQNSRRACKICFMDVRNSNSSKFTVEEIGMSLIEARETQWPILRQPPKTGQPMGKLLDAGLLTERDLAYLARNGHEPNCRKAAKVLLLEQLSKSEETSEIKEPPKIISPKCWTYAEVMQHRFTLLQGAIFGLVMGLLIAFEVHNFYKGVLNKSFKIPSLTQFIGLTIIIIVILLVGLLFFKLLDRINGKIDKQIDSHRTGRIGEELVIRVIQQALNKHWSVYLNLILPERKSADMDAVLIGPPGIWVLEIKNFDSQYRNTGEQWEFLSGTKWTILKKSPTKQVRKNAARLASFLKAGGINKNAVTPVVVWANFEKKPIIVQPLAAVWPLDSLQAELIQIDQQKRKFLPDEQKAVNDKLDSLYEMRDKKADGSGD
jgi:Nuclease-related domain